MNSYQIIANKIPATLINNEVSYNLPIEGEDILLNQWINKELTVEFTGKLVCLDCMKTVKKFYSPGLCYICTTTSAQNSPCIINPELCKAHLGEGRDIEWEKKYHLQPHIVYLANSGGLKVGVTRMDQIPTRWIDQGADETIILAKTPYRQLAGEIEVFLKQYVSDKTNWRTMLKNIKVDNIDLLMEKRHYASILLDNHKEYICEDDTIYKLNYPTHSIDGTITSIKLEKTNTISGILTGIKAQYLIFDHKNVLNLRSHGGFEIKIDV